MTLSLSSLSLFVATPAQILESRRRSFIEWGNGMTEGQYLERETSIDLLKCCRDGALIIWILAPRDNPTSLEFMCSCKTFHRDALVWRKDGTPNGDRSKPTQEKVVCYGIGTVYTPPANRGKGYAAHMMRLLHWVLASADSLPATFPEEWGPPPTRVERVGNGQCSVLWSDVGPNFYRRCGPTPYDEGWVVTGAASTIWRVSKGSSGSSKYAGGKWLWLDEAGALQLWERDAQNLTEDVQLAGGGSVAFVILPWNDVVTYQNRRHQFVLALQGIDFRRWGVVAVDGDSAASFATWTIDYPSRTLMITRLDCQVALFAELLDLAVGVAQEHGMDKVEIYNLPMSLQSAVAAVGGVTGERDEHLPSLKWYGNENASDVSWLLNERYAWC